VVGAFMLAGLISLAVLAIRVSGFNVGAEANTYNVFAKFENVSGLVVRAKVSIAGVIVGQVAEISLDQKSFTALVRMEIDSDVAELSIDSTAAILTEGLLGGKFIGLTIGADESYLKEGAYITDTQSSIVLEDMIGKFLMKQF
jgi:phospholipid/cholesterol/gamma-HCH transport system substrate-binding protein